MKQSLFEVFCVAAPKVIGGVGMVALNALLMRHFAPEQFGAYALCLAGATLADATIGSAVDLGVLRLAPHYRATDPERATRLQNTALIFKLAVFLVVCVLLAGALLLVESRAGARAEPAELRSLFALGCGAGLGLLLLRSVQTQFQVEGRFAHYGLCDLLQHAVRFGGVAVLIAAGGLTPGAALSLFAIGPAAVAAWWVMRRRSALSTAPLFDTGALGELLQLVKWYLATFCLASTLGRLDVLLLSSLAGAAEVGIFSAGQTFAMVPQLAGSYLAVVFAPRVIPYYHSGQLPAFFDRFQTAIITCCLVAYAVAGVVVGWGAAWLLPASFARSAGVILTLLPGTLAGLATFPLTITLIMFLRPRFLFLMDCLVFPLMTALYFEIIPRHGAAGAAWVTSAFSVIKALIALGAARRWARLSTLTERRGDGATGRRSDGVTER